MKNLMEILLGKRCNGGDMEKGRGEYNQSTAIVSATADGPTGDIRVTFGRPSGDCRATVGRLSGKVALIAVLLMMFGVGECWGTDWVRLDSIDFTNTTNFPANTYGNSSAVTTQTVHGVFIRTKSGKYIKVNDTTPGVDFNSQNGDASAHHIGIPVTGVNGTLKVIVYHDYNNTSASFKVGISHADDNDPSKSQTWDQSLTNSGTKNENDFILQKGSLSGTSYIVWVAETSTSYIVIKKVAIYTEAAACSAPTSPSISGTTAYNAGDNISLTASATGTSGSTTYQWYKGDPENGGVSQGAASTSGATFTRNSCVTGDAGTYYCVISNGTGCTTTTSQAITVSCLTAPVAPTSLTSSGQTGTTLTYTWTKASNASGYTASLWDNSTCTGDAVATQNLGDVATVTFSELSGSTTYYCKVQSKGNGTVYCADGGTTDAVSGTTTAVCGATIPGNISKGDASGGTGTITLTAAGSPASGDTWYWQSAEDGTTKTNSGTTYDVSAAGTYYVRSYNTAGDCWSDAKSVTVAAADLLTAISPTLSYASSVIVGNTLSPTLTGNTGSGTVTYSLNSVTPTGSLTINSSTGVVTGVTAGGTATVTATIAASGNYASGSATSGTITAYANPLGSHTLTWEITTVSGSSESDVSGGTTDIGTSDKYSSSTYISSLTNLTGVGVKRTTTGKNSNTGKIETPASFDVDKYVSMTFTVASGYQFTPDSVQIKTVAVSTAKDLKFVFSDASGSDTVKQASLSTSSTAARYNLDFTGSSRAYTGTVTVKIYVYGATNSYRLSTPLTIDGTVAEAASCDAAPAAPDGLAAGTITASGATFTITDDETPSYYDIYYSTSSTAPTSGTAATTTTNAKTKAVTGLSANTTYYAWVRAVCDASYKSSWVALSGSTFTTLKAQPNLYSVGASIEGACNSQATAKITLSGSQSGVSYQLKKNGSNDGDAKAGTGSGLEWTGKGSGVYTVWAVEGTYAARQMSRTVTVEKYDSTEITTEPSDISDAVASTPFIIGSDMVAAGHDLTYQWYSCNSTGEEMTELTDSTASTMRLTKTAGTYYYRVKVTGSCGTPNNDLSRVVTVTVGGAAATYNITWYVNGEEYITGTPTTSTTEAAGITTMPTAPADNTLSGCANSFRGWSETNLYGEATNTQPSDLFVDAAGAPTIDEDKTFYAIFGTATSAPQVGTVLWSEDWTGVSSGTTPSSPSASGSAVYGGASVSYSWANGKDSGGTDQNQSKVYSGTLAGGTTPEVIVGAKSGGDGTPGYLSISGIPKGNAKKVTVEYKTNANRLVVSVSGAGYSGSNSTNTEATQSFDITCGTDETFSLTFSATTVSNVRLDDIVVKIKEDGATGYRCICPSFTVTPKLITASTPIFITSAASQTVRSQDSLLITGSGLAKNATLSISSPASKFVLKSRTNGNITTDETGSIAADTYGFIYYTPSAGDTSDGLDKNASFTITDGTNSVTVDQALIGRHLPANFVIAVKKNSSWWALPANHASGTPAPIEIAVDDADNPTIGAIADTTHTYSLGQNTGKINGGYGQFVRLAMHGISPTGGSGYAPLFGSATYNLGQSGQSTMTGDLGKSYWWRLTQYNTSITNATDAKYYLSCPNNSNSYHVRLYTNSGEKWGQYSGGSDELRLLPFEYAITLDDNGGSADGLASVAPNGTSATIITEPTYTDHTVDYYFENTGLNQVLDPNGSFSAADVSNGSSYDYIEDGKWVASVTPITLEAHWKCNTPEISCTSNTITITVPSGATVYYTTTTDGSTPATPTSSSTAYNPSSKPTISADTKIKAIAIQDGCTSSEVASANLTYSGGGGDCEVIARVNVKGASSGIATGTLIGSATVSLENTTQNYGDSTGYKLGGSKYLALTLESGEYFQNGDSVIVYLTKLTDLSSVDNKLHIYAGTNTTTTEVVGLSSPALGWNRAVLSNVPASTSSINIHRGSSTAEQNHYINTFIVKRCEACDRTPDAPTSLTNGAKTSNSQAVSWTDSSNDKWEVYVSTSSSTPDGSQTPTASPTSKSYTFTGLTASTTYYWWVRSVCDASHKSAWTAGTSFTTDAAAATYTVTYNYNGATGGSGTASETASSVTLPTPTRTDYEFDGWYKTDGTKVGVGGATYNPTADITLYARWETECVGGGAGSTTNVTAAGYSTAVEKGGSNVVFTTTPSLGFKYKTATATVNSSTSAVTRNNAVGCQIKSDSQNRGSIKTTSAYSNVDSISFYFAATSSSAGKVIVLYSTDNFADDSTTLLSATAIAKSNGEFMRKTLTLPVAKKANSLTFKFRFAPTSSGVTHYIDSLKIFTSTGSGTCYSVKYCGNGATSGYVNDTLSHLSGSNVTVLGNIGRYPFVRAGYTFNGWNTVAGGGGTSYAAGATISSISSDVTLHAQWLSGTNYTVTYNGNNNTSGTAPTDASSPYASGTDVTVLGNTGSLAKTGYTFDGWATNNDGTGTSYAEDDEIEDIAANTTLYAKWKQTVTLNTGLQGEGADKTPYVYFNGAALNGFTAHSVAGYELQGYYTASSGGTKVLNANGSFAASAVTNYITDSKWSRTNTTTLYAQWRASAGSTCYEWDAEETKPRTGTDENFGGLYLTASTKTKVSFYSGHTADSCYSVSKASQILTGHLNGTEIGSVKFKASSSDASNNTFMISFGSTVPFDTAHIIQVSSKDYVVKTVNKNDAAASEYTVTAPAGTKSFAMGRNGSAPHLTGDDLKNSGSRYLYYLYVCSAGGGTHTISYNNGGGSGSMSSHSSIADNGSQTLTSNSFTAPTNYTFAGWVTDVPVTIGGDTKAAGTLIADESTITNITTDINLTAKWGLDLKLETGAQGSDADEDLTVYYNSTSITGHTPHTAGGYRLLGYYTASSDGTKVLNADGTFASTAVDGYIADGKWTYTSASSLTLYGQWETSSLLKWNLQTNKSESSISTTSKESATVRILTENMTNLTNNGSLTITGSAKTNLTSKIATTSGTTGDDAGKYMSVQFQIANGYKLVPTAINVKAQPISHSQTVKLVLEDNNSHSIDYTSSSISKGSTQTVTMSNGSSVEFMGTVTLKIYCYGTAESDGYRLGTPIEINGAVEEACTMPSYSGLDYEQAEYIKDASASAISVTGATDVTTYAWKQNTSNDRNSGSAASGTNNADSYTPPTSSVGTMYYWCELTNDCGTVKTPTIAITVRTDKSDPTVTWTNPASTPNYGGGGYIIKATVNETDWSGTLTSSMLAAPAGIRIYSVTTGTAESKKWIQAYFDIQTTFDRSTYSANIPFTLSLPETNYEALADEHEVAYSNCSAAGEGTSYNIRVRKVASHIDNKYYWDNADGWISPDPANSIGSSKAGTKMETVFDSVSSNNGKYVNVRTYHANINKVRIYADFRGNNMTVTNVYKHSDFFTANAKYEVDCSVVYNGDENADDLGTAAQGYVDITLNEMMAENDIVLIKFNDSKVRPLGAVITESSAGSLTTTLGWKSGKAPSDQSGWDGTNSKLVKTQSAANFTCAVEPITSNTNTLGTITYSSSNTSCATVNATTGEVTITATGTETLSTTITATLSASGCYTQATLTYTLEVTGQECTISSGGTLALTSGSASKCEGTTVTLTLSGYDTDGTTVTWYRDETDVTASVSDNTLTTSAVGSYSVLVSNGVCSKRSNSISITNKSAEAGAAKLVDEWYIKQGRLTPDIALFELSGAADGNAGWAMKTGAGADLSSIAGCSFERKGDIIYLHGYSTTGVGPTGIANAADETIKVVVTDACGSTTTSETIIIHKQVQTDKHVLAFVVNGKGKGGFTEGITATQTTSVPLYNTLAENFDIQATNIYSTDDEKKIKEYYSQFDILCVTDYPNTQTKGVNKKSYVDALGSLIDIRPILTMEAFVSKLDNWKAKGISGTPQSPSERQYSMLLQCKDHEIFAGTTLTKIGEGDEAMYRINMVDNTKEDYNTLDGYTPGTKDYKAGDNPALQGFTYTNDLKDLLPLGLIDDGSGNDLQVGIERQEEMEARLLVLGINSYAMERLTDDGVQVVINALKYLMKKNAEDIADCSNYFIGGAEGDSDNWANSENWSGNTLPDRTQKVRILAPCVIKAGTDPIPHVAGVVIVPDGQYNHGANEAEGSLTIEAGGTLIVDGQIEKAMAPYYYEVKPTDPSNLILNTSSTAQSALILDNEDGKTQATINIYSKSNKVGSTRNWQYMAIPIQEASVSEFFYGVGTYTYKHIEAQGGWVRYGLGTMLNGFDGVGLTQPEAECQTYTFYGPLVDTDNHRFYPTYANSKESKRGTNIVGNSWTAPINLLALAETRATDMVNLDLDIAIYNTGKDKKTGDEWDTPASRTEAGTWEHIPLTLAGEYDEAWLGAKVIPAYQAFQIKATAADAMLNIDYERCVRNSVNADHVNDALRAPARRGVRGDDRQLLRIAVQDTIGIDYIYLIEGPEFTEGYDNGWEAAYSKGITFGKLYALDAEANKKMALARPDLEGTMVGFVPGVSNTYTITFNQTEGYYYLNDLKKEESTLIQKGNSYTFTVEEGDAAERFMISGTPFVKTNPTGVEEMENGKWKMENVRKVIYNDHLYIIRGGRIYGADGATVK